MVVARFKQMRRGWLIARVDHHEGRRGQTFCLFEFADLASQFFVTWLQIVRQYGHGVVVADIKLFEERLELLLGRIVAVGSL